MDKQKAKKPSKPAPIKKPVIGQKKKGDPNPPPTKPPIIP